jgi:RHS repeat-associated protein
MAYNWLGQQTSITEPNAGTRTTRYHRTGQVERTTDAVGVLGQSITTVIDNLGRTLSIHNGPSSASPKLAEYTYDPSIPVNGGANAQQKGMVASATSYWEPNVSLNTGGQRVSYATEKLVTARAKAVDSRGRLTKSSVQLESSTTPGAVNLNAPSANDDSLFIEYFLENAFTRNDQIWKQVLPSVGTTFAAEELTTAFTSLGLPNTLKTDDPFGGQINGSGPRFWVTETGYDPLGRIITRRLASAQTSGASTLIGLDRTYTYRTDDGRIDTIAATVNGGVGVNGHRVQRDVYTYDHAGNPTEIRHDPYLMTGYNGPGTGTINPTGGLASEDDHECHYYDPKGRLIDTYTEGRPTPTSAFTACVGYNATTGAPTGAPANPANGPAPYRETNTFGDLTRFTSKAGRTYSYNAADGLGEPSSCTGTIVTRPDAVRAISIAGTSTVVEKYRYDCNGSITEVQEDLNTTPVTWTYRLNTLNRVQTVKRNSDVVSTNAYDVTGQRVVRQDPDGKRTLYLGAIDISHTTAGGLSAVKQYPSIQRTPTGATFTASNHQGSLAATLTNTSTTSYLRYRPYGDQRGPGIAPNERAFLNQVKDTGQSLTYLNQRSVDTQTATFTTVDPLVVSTRDPYIYANANPVGLSDPSGLCVFGAPCPVDEIIDAAGDTWDAGTDVVGDALDLGSDLITDAVDAGGGFFSGLGNRLATLGTYHWDATLRRIQNPTQTAWDVLSGTVLIEQVSALETILFDDARLYKEGEYCGVEAECFTGSDALGSADATTTGHTIRFSGTDEPLPSTIVHEMVHMYDIENLGGVPFYVLYLGAEVACWCYRESYFERRAYNLKDGEKPRGVLSQAGSRVWDWVTTYRVPPPGPVFGTAPQVSASSSSGSNSSGSLRPTHGAY